MEIELLQHGSKKYQEMVDLRMKILRKPLGLSFTQPQLDAEKDDLLIGAFENDRLIGCCVLTKRNEKEIQLRQMAVDTDLQTGGIGRRIMEFAEKIAKEKGFSIMMMHAREVATGFYKKCGYNIHGDVFEEVTIPHFHMEKKL